MSLESYVQTGLDDEWIPSWATESIKAGSVAYRTYGVWFTKHPKTSTYDIRSDTYNQVWESDQSTVCIAAANSTTGEVLVNSSNAIVFSEYAAETNGFSCGDCYSGETGAWPCFLDQVCCGKTKNGHGRGMCQYGSNRWAMSPNNKLYTWILDHYYNPGGYYRYSSSETLAPVNDNCSTATLLTSLTSLNYLTNQTVNNASSSGKPKAVADTYSGSAALADVWYNFQAVGTSTTITVDPGGSGLDAIIVVYNSCSTNSEISSSDTPGAGISTLTFATTPGSTYYIRIYDYGAQTTNGGFNICVSHASVSKPDLTITSGTQTVNPITVAASGSVTVSCSEDNSGTVTAGANDVTVWLSTDAVLSTSSDTYLGKIAFPALSPNTNSITYSTTLQIPSTTLPGTYYVYFWADGNQVVPESDETQNFASRTITVTAAPALPDLVVQNPQVTPTTVYQGLQITASCSIKNQGTGAAGTSYTTVWLSSDQKFDGVPADVNLGDISVSSLTPGQATGTLSRQVTLPIGSYAGTWYIMFGANSTGVVSESNHTNNQVFVPISYQACTLPAQPGAISGSASVCDGISQTYSVSAVSGATSYIWTLPSGWTGISTTNSITVIPNSSGGSVSVKSSNACGSSTSASSLNVQSASQAAPKVVIAITSGTNPTCLGQSVTFAASPTNGGTNPTYQWKVGTTNVATGQSYTVSSLANGQVVTCLMTSNATCAAPVAATSNSITMIVNSTTVVPKVDVAITAGANPSCSGQAVTFSAAPTNGGASPSYQWKVGTANVGSGPTYTSSSLTNGQIVSCTMTSSLPCANPLTSTSSPITMAVGTSAVPAVSVAVTSGNNPSCAGQPIGFTATPINGGTSPSFQWKVNNVDVVTGQTFSALNLTSGQVVTCIMTPNLPCASLSSVSSVPITVTTNPSPNATVTASGPTAFFSGGSVVLRAATGAGYSYRWYLNGTAMPNATGTSYTATKGGSYMVEVTSNGCSAMSSATVVTSLLPLPPNNFTLTTTGESCRSSNNGSASITAVQPLNYTAVITGSAAQLKFTNALNIPNLSAGAYSVCITIDGNSDFKQCFGVNITEPKDLSVFADVNNPLKTVQLKLSGGSVYQIELNGRLFSTSNSEITLPAAIGKNRIKVTADNLCQGVFEQAFTIPDGISIYPNPFEKSITINVGPDKSPKAAIEIRNISGRVLYSKEATVSQGIILLNDLPDLPIGIYILHLKLSTLESEYKIMRQ
jgi:hypothetical protein